MRSSAARSMPTPVSRDRQLARACRSCAAAHRRSVPPPGMRVKRVLDDVGQGAREHALVDHHQRQRLGHIRLDGARVPRVRLRYGSTTSAISSCSAARRRPGRRRGREARKLARRSVAAAAPASGCCRRIRRARAPSGAPRSCVHAAQVLGVQLDRRQRVLDVVRDLPRHVGPRGEPVASARARRAGAADRRPCG